MVRVVGVRFKKACKVYDFEAEALELNPGDTVIVEVERGLGLGTVVYTPREVDPATLTRPLKKIVRKADPVDVERQGFNTEREIEAFRICRERITKYNLPMKLIRVEYLFDSSKAIFYFTSDTRVDFRELVKDLAATFHTRIEMRQIGVRDEAKMIGGLGPCGRELCCSGFLADFEPVTIKMAKEQNLALNPVKISGICGRLMCCLSYEHDFYQNERRKDREREKEQAARGETPEGQQPEKKERDGREQRGGRGGRDRGRPGQPQKEHGCGGCGKHGEHGAHSHGAPQASGGRPDRQPEKQGDRPERPERQGRPDRQGRPERQGRPDRQDRKDRGPRQDRGPRPNRPEQPQAGKQEQSANRPAQSNKPEQPVSKPEQAGNAPEETRQGE
jgi:cell fate regulator YaaT (PSP1 superfamily)